MGRYRSRSYSPRRSRSPPRRKRYDDARDSRSRRHRRSPAPSGLLVRNIALDARPEDLRTPFERFGPIKDVYLPKDYYSGEPRGFGFVKFRYAEDAAEAKQRLNYSIIGGREIRIVFAEENRKTPHEMRRSTHTSGQGSYRRQSLLRSPRRHYRSYSRSPSPARGDLRDRKARDDYHSPRRLRSSSRSISPHVERNCLTNPKKGSGSVSEPLSPPDERNRRSNPKSPTPGENGRRPHDERDYTPSRSQSPKRSTRGLLRSRS